MYPDIDDAITNALIARSPYPGYWEKSEDRAFVFLERTLAKKDPGLLLDLGCGQGRLLVKFARYFKQAVALDCDASRLAIARKMLDSRGMNNIDYVDKPFLDTNIKNSSFDIVICSHVVQHIPSGDCPSFFSKLRGIIKPGGILALSTNHSPKKTDFYLKDSLRGFEVDETEIGEDEFNNLVANQESILPIHCFSNATLARDLTGLNIIGTRVFHFLYKKNIIDSIAFRDSVGNMPFSAAKPGRDVMVTALKATR